LVFIPIAEELGLIDQIGALKEAGLAPHRLS